MSNLSSFISLFLSDVVRRTPILSPLYLMKNKCMIFIETIKFITIMIGALMTIALPPSDVVFVNMDILRL